MPHLRGAWHTVGVWLPGLSNTDAGRPETRSPATELNSQRRRHHPGTGLHQGPLGPHPGQPAWNIRGQELGGESANQPPGEF